MGALRRWADTDGVKTSRHHRERRAYRLCSGLTLRAGGDARPYRGPDAANRDAGDARPYRGLEDGGRRDAVIRDVEDAVPYRGVAAWS